MRVDNWPRALDEYVELKRSAAFEWGANDCAAFAKGAVEAISDTDLSDLDMNYRTALGAKRFLAKHDCEDLWALIDTRFERVDVKQAQRGDLIAHKTEDKSVGVCLSGMFATVGDKGLIFATFDDAISAWRVK